MCGVAGILDFKTRCNPQVIKRMSDAIVHRGPDASGIFIEDTIALAHNRLSIIDVSECSNQPMSDFSGRFTIVFNGEIYNYKELKAQLPDYPYATQGDTEVILAAFSKWGPACLQNLIGMFSFAIWDAQEQVLFLARDRMGVKPLYYYRDRDKFVFASEVRAILASGLLSPQINTHAVSDFLQFQSVGTPYTIISGIQPLEAGSYMTVSDQGLHKTKYWNYFSAETDFNFQNLPAVKTRIKNLLQQSVARRMISDVPVAGFLSGGIDSSAVVGLMASLSSTQINTFTVGFEEKEFDESPYAAQIVRKFNTHHHEIRLKADHFLTELIPALNAMDSPTGDGVNSFVVCKAIRNSGIKVALSGVGGDELFAGYPIFRQYSRIMKFERLWKTLLPIRYLIAQSLSNSSSKNQRIKQLLSVGTANIQSFYPSFRQIISRDMLASCTSLPEGQSVGSILNGNISDARSIPLLSKLSVAEYSRYTQHTLLKDMDQMSMASSLEVREPFFDHELIQFVLRVPDQFKLTSYPKQLLVESLGDLLPPQIVHRKKQGFLFPWNEWMKTELRSFCDRYITEACNREFINGPELKKYWEKFLKNDSSVRWMEIWLFVVLEYWLQRNYDRQ